MSDLMNDLSKVLYGNSRADALKNNVCVKCGKEATEFVDAASENEYQLTAWCQDCQDIFYSTEEAQHEQASG